MPLNKIFKHVLFIAAAILLNCMNPTVGTDTGNGLITGKLFEPDGQTPAAGAIVHLRKRSPAPQAVLSKKSADEATVVTNSNGLYSVDKVAAGMYVIEGSDNDNNLVYIDSISIQDTLTPKKVPDDTLKPAGAIKGVIKLVSGGDPRKVLVVLYEVQRLGQVETNGSFKINNLAEGKYDLRLIPGLENYNVLDTFSLPVRAGDTLDLGTISLGFSGIPVPGNVRLRMDSVTQIVTVSWDQSDTSLVKGYNIFRRKSNESFGTVPLNSPEIIVGTSFSDSMAWLDSTYEYKVVAVDKGDNSGKMSAGVSVKVVSAFYADTLNQFNAVLGEGFSLFKITRNNEYVFTKYLFSPITGYYWLDSISVQRFSASGALLSVTHFPAGRQKFDVDDSGNVFAFGGTTLNKYNSQGIFLVGSRPFDSTQLDNDNFQFFELSDTLVFVISQLERKVIGFSTGLDSLFSWNFSTTAMNFCLHNAGTLFFSTQTGSSLEAYSIKGDLLNATILPVPGYLIYNSGDTCIIVQSKKSDLIISQPMVYGFDSKGNLLYRIEYTLSASPFCDNDGNLFFCNGVKLFSIKRKP